MNMVMGFTGTQQGMTYMQERNFRDLINGDWVEFHHGDCIGADAQAHDIVTERGKEFIRIVVHPPADPKKRAFKIGNINLPPKAYLLRNHDIVDACDGLIATPAQAQEELRSGTWATIRYARKQGKPIFLLLPNGRFEEVP